MNMMKISRSGVTLCYDPERLHSSICVGDKKWIEDTCFEPFLTLNESDSLKKILFSSAKQQEVSIVKTGYCEEIRTVFSGFEQDPNLKFAAIWRLNKVDASIIAELIPLHEPDSQFVSVVWPGPICFNTPGMENYTVLPLMQGTLIPNGWDQEINIYDRWELEAGTFYTRSCCMPWWGQIEGTIGYMALALTPFDAGFDFCHHKRGNTSMGVVWHSSLGKLSYTRKLSYRFYNNCNYNTFCKIFRAYLIETGELNRLHEKIIKNPNVAKLIGSSIVHTDIYYRMHEDSFFFSRTPVDQQSKLTSFDERARNLTMLKKNGLNKAFVHIDGWIKEGYDSQHPDTMPPCEVAGGLEGMQRLVRTTKDLGYQFAIHDQYRDYYVDAPSYDKNYAIVDQKGNIPFSHYWYGGKQAFLCAEFAPDYVKRNFNELKNNGINLDGAYLDVFSCVRLDECYHNEHPMTRKKCMENRSECINYVRSQGIIVSSEEPIGWAIRDLDLVHHSPYAMINEPDENQLCGNILPEPFGIPVPLINLVYHDCIVIPWYITSQTQEMPNHESGFLHAILNGGIPYVDIYASCDDIKTAAIVSELNEKVALDEMLSHEFVCGSYKKQKTIFSSGLEVTVDFDTKEYNIKFITSDNEAEKN